MAPGALDEHVYKERSYDARPTLTVLMQACSEGAPLAHVSTLLAGRPNVNAVDRGYGRTAVSLACDTGREDMVRKLLEANADPNIAAIRVGGRTPLIVASSRGYASIVSALISSGANVNYATHAGRTALMWACDEGHVDVVRVLVDARADVNRTNVQGQTALDMARRLGCDDIVAMLVDAGAVR